ncbi:SRPBCC family protein [Cryobacterium sp. Y11]|uniref:SRPBCC family protein n=1 Tax=Cryobacterium sp. Y11 TaxID=2045016 RepID=UPI000CE2FA54|nr:SRPBCC family protein [Cryobacterium sp. Y11]
MINATSTAIATILADIRRLPEWNPAILSVTTVDSLALVGKPYRIRAKLPGSPTITYDEIADDNIVWRLDGFQAHEAGAWKLVPAGDHKTEVTHTITHSGAIFRVLAGAFQTVPGLRLDRLQRRAEYGE